MKNKEKKKQKKLKKNPFFRQMMSSNNQSLERENKLQPWKPFLNLVKSVKLPWVLIIISVIISLSQSSLAMLFPQYTEQIYAGNFTTQLAITAMLVILGQALLGSVSTFVFSYTTNVNQMRIQQFVWRRLSRLPLSYFEKNEPRDLISRTTSDTTRLSEFFANALGSFLSSIYVFIGSLVLIFGYNWKLAASMLICLPLCYVVGIIAGRMYYKASNKVQGKLSDLTRYFSAVLPYITLTKFFGQEKREEQHGAWWIEKNYETGMSYAKTFLIVAFANAVTTVVQELVIILVGVWLIQAGEIDVAVWVAFYMYANQLAGSFSSLMNQWQGLKEVQGICARVSATTNEKPEENRGIQNASCVEPAIAFENVSFSYDEKPVLKNVSFQAPAGKLTAIVGPSGAGKSTAMGLIERFYAPQEGSVTLAGVDAQEYELYGWRQNIGYIPQDCQLFSGTIRDNIAYGVQGEVSEEAIREAAKKANALDFIEEFENGFDTEVGENGAKLSGGQRQRIAIARALLKNAKLFLLDEITSNLDAEAESYIRQTLETLRKDNTVIMVAHHMDSVRAADQILVMENGSLVGSGTHDSLMDTCPLYRDMVQLQYAGIAI